MISRDKRIERQIADIQETWNKDEIAKLIDRVHYNGVISQAQDFAKTRTMDFDEVADQMVARRLFRNKPSGIQCGIKIIDAMTFGFRPGEVIIIAGPSSHGKTAIALNIAVSAIETNPGLNALFISLEMDTMEIFDRADHIADNPTNLRGHFRVQLDRRVTLRNIGNIIAANPDADLVFIDHLHMMTRLYPGLSAKDAIDQATNEVKTLAGEFNKPIVLLAHIGKARSGENGEATTADLMGSAGIEQLADFVIMVNADKSDRRVKVLTLGKSRTKQTVGEGHKETIFTDGLKIIPNLGMFFAGASTSLDNHNQNNLP